MKTIIIFGFPDWSRLNEFDINVFRGYLLLKILATLNIKNINSRYFSVSNFIFLIGYEESLLIILHIFVCLIDINQSNDATVQVGPESLLINHIFTIQLLYKYY